MKIDKLPLTITEALESEHYREMLITLVGYGRHGMIYKKENDVSREIDCLFDLELIYQRKNYNDTIIYCSAICVRALLNRKLIRLEDIPIRERGQYKK